MAKRPPLDLSQRQPVPAASIPSFSPLYVSSGVLAQTGNIFAPNAACTVRWFIVQVLGACTVQLLNNGEPASAPYQLASGQFVRFAGRFCANNVVFSLALTPSTACVYEVVWTKEIGPHLTLDQTSVFSGVPAAASPTTVIQPSGSLLHVDVDNFTPTKATYSVGDSFTPSATAKAAVTIFGSASKIVKITRILCSLVNGSTTAGSTGIIFVEKNTAVFTGGTATAETPVPNDSNDAAPTATVNTYSVAPTGGGGTPTAIVGCRGTIPMLNGATLDAGIGGLLQLEYTPGKNAKPLTLNGVAQGLSIVPFFNAGSISGAYGIEWTEE